MTITQTKLKEHLIYYPESGIFRHKTSGRQYTKTFTASQKIEAVLWLETTRKQLHEGFANNGGVF